MALSNPTVSASDGVKTIQLVAGASLTLESPVFVAFLQKLVALAGSVPVASITLTTLVLTFTLKDARTFTVTYIASPPTFGVESSGNFSQTEFGYLQDLARNISTLIVGAALTALDVEFN